jgi:hypothetical protein
VVLFVPCRYGWWETTGYAAKEVSVTWVPGDWKTLSGKEKEG